MLLATWDICCWWPLPTHMSWLCAWAQSTTVLMVWLRWPIYDACSTNHKHCMHTQLSIYRRSSAITRLQHHRASFYVIISMNIIIVLIGGVFQNAMWVGDQKLMIWSGLMQYDHMIARSACSACKSQEAKLAVYWDQSWVSQIKRTVARSTHYSSWKEAITVSIVYWELIKNQRSSRWLANVAGTS